MNVMRRGTGTAFLGSYRLVGRVWAKAFSLVAGGAFASFGRRTVLEPPIRLGGERRIAVGNDVFIGRGSWLQVLDGEGDGVALEIGDGTSIVGFCVLSAAQSVRLGEKVLIARGAYISDHMHAHDDPSRAVLDQGIGRVRPVEIGDGAWLGENVVIGPGVRIGPGAVIGANSVVLEDVPAHSVAAGAPARVVRKAKTD
jgi:acetyltransferase-like isoleucine patch superfamily enzyme